MEMAGPLPWHPSLHSTVGDEACSIFHDVAEGLQCLGPGWYLSRKEIEDNSPSRMDGIDLKKETQLRNLYCSFLHDIGKKLKVPQVTIATAMMFCHRFYLRQSLARNEWQTIATTCMFLASKVEETPCLLMDVVVVAYETMYRRDPVAAQRIKQKEVFEKQKELILTAERVLLSTIAYDFNVQHPYTPLVAALKKFKIASDVGKVAWNFVNDWLRTTLCLQYKPHYIAAGSLFLAAKFCRVKLPSDKGMVWWHEFDITPRKFEEVTQQMLNTLEQNRKTVTPRAREKVTQAPLIAEKAASDSPESCVLNGSAIATTSSHVLEEGGRDYPANSLSCSHRGKDLALDNNDTHVAGGGYLECQISDCGSAYSIVEDVERSDEGADQAGIESNHIVGSVITSVCEGIEDGKRYEGVDQSRIESNHIVGSGIISVCQSLEDGKRLNEGEDQTRIGSNNLITGSSNISACKFLAESDIARIKAKLKRKRCERAMDAEEAPLMEDVASDDAWIERALENGIVPGVEKTQKKQRQI